MLRCDERRQSVEGASNQLENHGLGKRDFFSNKVSSFSNSGLSTNKPAPLLAPFVYLQIVAATVLGWIIWRQFPDALSWLGIAIVCGSGVVVSIIEWRDNQAVKRMIRQSLSN